MTLAQQAVYSDTNPKTAKQSPIGPFFLVNQNFIEAKILAHRKLCNSRKKVKKKNLRPNEGQLKVSNTGQYADCASIGTRQISYL